MQVYQLGFTVRQKLFCLRFVHDKKKYRGKDYEKCSNKDCLTNQKTKTRRKKDSKNNKAAKTLKDKAEIEATDE